MNQQLNAQAINEQDSLALVAYYNSTHGDQWLDNSGWLKGPVSSWVGIEEVANVAGEGEPQDWRVIQVDMPRNNMTVPGPFPPELANLEYCEFWKSDVNLHSGGMEVFAEMPRLTEMLIRSNLLTGEIPWDKFGNKSNLEEFRIRHNYFTGSLPDTLGVDGQWKSIRRIYVDDNYLTGQIPKVVADSLPNFRRVYLQNNNLTGPIPDWSGLENFEYYRIGNNDLEPGPIPMWIINSWSSSLIRFQIQNTNRTGSLPQEFAQMEALEQFIIGGKKDEIGDGQTTADIPDMSNMPSLRRINFQGGGWSGPLPQWIGSVPSLEDVTFENMDITGQIPDNLADADNISLIHLENLNIEGGIPDAFQLATNIQELNLIDNPNMSVGDIPQWIGNTLGNLTELRLEDVGVTGTIPDNLRNLQLSALDLADNPDLSGSLPSWFSNRNWSELELSRTSIELNQIPSWLDGATNLSYLGLGGLGLEGNIPTFFGEGLHSVNMSVLALDDNNLTGEIPAELGQMQQLDSLNLGGNQLSGEIPEGLTNAGRITDDLNLLSALILKDNPDLTGPVPMGFTDAQYMRVLEYSGTDLCEPDNATYQNWIDGIPDFAASRYPEMYYKVETTGVKCTDVAVEKDSNPYAFALEQNYPNPFNPSTNIAFQIPKAAQVKLTVYNMLGRKVATLVNEYKQAGNYTINFKSSQLSSGSYIYKLEAGDKVESKTMMFIK